MNVGALAVRADGGASIGAGHVMRSLALADVWQRQGGTVDWFSTELPPMLAGLLRSRGVTLHQLTDAHDWQPLVEWSAAHRAAWVAIDGYGFFAGHVRLRAAGARVLVIDDDGRWPHYECDILLNQNIGAEDIAYETSAPTQRLLGTQFVLLREEFRRHSPSARDFAGPARKLFVSFGGHDARGMAARVAEALTAAGSDLELDVAAGVMSEGEQPVPGRVRRHAVTELAPLMRDADIAMVAAGSVCWELAYFGVPALTAIVAGNQQGIARGLHRAGVTRDLGWVDTLSDDAIVDAVETLRRDSARQQMSERGRMLVDGKGADRVVTEMVR